MGPSIVKSTSRMPESLIWAHHSQFGALSGKYPALAA